MAKFVVDSESVRLTIAGLRGSVMQIQIASDIAVERAGRLIEANIRENVSIPAFGATPRLHAFALRAIDHPYAKRHSEIQVAPLGGHPGFRRRQLLVHTVSGRLARSIRGTFKRVKAGPEFRVRADRRIAPHAKFVIEGTRVMHPRDILFATLVDPTTQREVLGELVFVLGRIFRTGGSVRLG